MIIEKKLNTICAKDYCEIKNYKYTTIYNEYLQKTYFPNYFEYDYNGKMYSELNYPETYICELKDVNIIGENNIIFDDEYCVYDMPFRDTNNKFRLEIRNITDVNNKNVTFKYDNFTEEKNIKEGIMLISPVSYNYYHFNVEVLTKLCVIDKIPEYQNIPLIVDKRVYITPQLREELEMISNKREIIYIDCGVLYKVEKLIHISDMIILPYNLKKESSYRYEDCLMNKIGINLLSKKLTIKSNPHRKLFISRNNGSIKRLKNWEEVESIFKEYEFEIIYPENMTFKEQLQIFSEAEFIAGASGSGLANIIFTNENSKLICIYPKEIELNCYSNLARMLGKEDYYLDAQMEKNRFGYEYNTGDFTLDINYLRKFLEYLKNK